MSIPAFHGNISSYGQKDGEGDFELFNWILFINVNLNLKSHLYIG